MTAFDRARLDTAIRWVVRIQDAAFHDWDGHAAWLAADPRNVVAYHEAFLRVEAGLAHLPEALAAEPAASNDDAPVWRGGARWWLAGGGTALAASLAWLVAVAPQSLPPPSRTFATGPGETRTMRMTDGTTVALNGDTLVEIPASTVRTVRLRRGEVLVSVVHDPARPFELLAGDSRFRDIGTIFNAVRTPGTVRVAVKEGEIAFDPPGRDIRLTAGRGVEVTGGQITLRDLPAAAVGGWRYGRLVYNASPIAEVASDLSRTIGVRVRVASAIAAQKFSGTILVDPDPSKTSRRVAAVLGTSVREADGALWIGY